MNKVGAEAPSYADLESRLLEMEAVVAALRDHQVDAIVGENDVALVHLRQVEEALRESGERYQAFVRNSSEGIWRYEMDPPLALSLDEEQQIDYILRSGTVAECNDAMARLAGYERASELIGFRGFLSASDMQVRAVIAQFVRSGYRVSYVEAPGTAHNGSPRWLAMSLLGIPKNGRLARIWGVQRDITERRRAEEELRQRTSELSALLAITRELAGTLELQPLLDNILAQLHTVADFTAAAVAMREDDQLVVTAYDGPLPAEAALRGRMPLAELPSASALSMTRKPIIFDDVSGMELVPPELRLMLPLEREGHTIQARSWLIAPLIVKNKLIGILAMSHVEPRRFTAWQAELAQAFADHAAVAIENARLYSEARQLAVVNERQRLAAELHDSVSQAIYSISLSAHTGLSNLEQRPQRTRTALNQILNYAEVAFTDIRSLIFELRPETLARHGLVAAIERQAESLRTRERAQVHLDLGREPEVSIETKEALYRIAQECLNNIVKHARAKSVSVRLALEGREICLEIHDDGKGFDPELEYTGHLGLRVMHERAERLGGSVLVKSAPRGGTSVVARLPISLS